MKKEKGKQVFSGDIDEMLAGKIIEHTELNSEDAAADLNANPSTANSCDSGMSCISITKVVGWSLVIIGLLVLLSQYFKSSNIKDN